MENRRKENGRINSATNRRINSATNGRISSATNGFRPKSGKSSKRPKNGLKNNIQKQTEFALDIQTIHPDIRAIMKKKPPMSEQALELFECIRNKEYLKVKKMVKTKDCETNTRDVDDPLYSTPLLVAAELDDTEMVKLLIYAKHRPANVNDENLNGRRAVWIATKNKNTEMVELLVDGNQECQVNVVDRQTGTTPLFEAVLGNSVDVAKLLIHARANVNKRRLGVESGPDTPLTKAIQLNNKEMVETLLNSLAKLNTKSESGLSALHYAVAYRRYDICEILLENGAKIHARTNSGVTPMAVAIENHNPAMVRILLENGYKMDKKYKWKETPLQQAICVHAEDCAMTLLHYGCSLKKENGDSYFSMSVNEKMIKVVKFLIALNPLFLNEKWIQNEEWPVSLYHRPDIFEWLRRESRKVRSLMFHCRAHIFHYLGRHPKNKIPTLPLPEKLKEYLEYNEYIKDKYYVKKPLDVRECPFDCPSLCNVPHCAPIEVSSESDKESADEIESEGESNSTISKSSDQSDQSDNKNSVILEKVRHSVTKDQKEKNSKHSLKKPKKIRFDLSNSDDKT